MFCGMKENSFTTTCGDVELLLVVGLVMLVIGMLLVVVTGLVVVDWVVGIEEVRVFEAPALEQPPTINIPNIINEDKLRINPVNNIGLDRFFTSAPSFPIFPPGKFGKIICPDVSRNHNNGSRIMTIL